MITRAIVIFPYRGFKNKISEDIFWRMINACQKVIQDTKTIIVINRDTIRTDETRSWCNNEYDEGEKLEKLEVWSVDTCQMWLAGWGHIFDNYPETDRIVQLPGDIDFIDTDPDIIKNFIKHVKSFVAQNGQSDIVIGDFISGKQFSAKDLIDLYGTYALLANWFPKVAKQIRSLPLQKPRSEFINIRKTVLEELLEYRKFAYEQTLNMLIRSWDFKDSKWKYKIKIQSLGTFQDDNSMREYKGCLDQIERTERMLRLLWREMNSESKFESFINDYDTLDNRSRAICENARITIRSLIETNVNNI